MKNHFWRISKMKKSDMVQILSVAKLLYGNQELTGPQIDAWFYWFGKADAKEFYAAVQSATKSNKFFPTPGEVQAHLEKIILPPTLKMTAQEALDISTSEKLLIADARNFADRNSLVISTEQFDSPESLQRANKIQQATWEREFKNRFQNQQERALSLVRSGIEPRKAILEVTNTPGTIQISAPIWEQFIEASTDSNKTPLHDKGAKNDAL